MEAKTFKTDAQSIDGRSTDVYLYSLCKPFKVFQLRQREKACVFLQMPFAFIRVYFSFFKYFQLSGAQFRRKSKES